MAETALEKATCTKCGVDVREGTSFCYNCGNAVTEQVPSANGGGDASSAALAELAAKLDIEKENETADDGKMARAAEERRKARVSKRKPKEFVWQPVEESAGLRSLLLAILVAVIAAAMVLMTVYWK